MSKVDYSVIVPFYNEEENLPQLHEELMGVLGKLKLKSEVVYVNDGSRDQSVKVLQKKISQVKKDGVIVKIVSLLNNSGQTAAIAAGVDKSAGELVSFLDADLQNDPADLPRFVSMVNEGYDAVFGWRRSRKDKSLRSFMSRSANLIIQFLFSYPFHDVGCSARIVRRRFLKNIQIYGELHRILPVLIYLKGARVAEIEVRHRPRTRGKSKYGFERIIKTLIDLITIKFLHSYGTKPAYIFGTLGFGCFGLGLLALLFGWLTAAAFFVLLGVQLVMMGLLAELQVRTYFESQKKPIYEIRDIID